MKVSEVQAIQRAIVAGVNEALEGVLANPFPPGQTGTEPDYRTRWLHTKAKVEQAVKRQLQGIVTTG